MYRIATDPQFTHTVPVEVPVNDGHDTQTMRARYRVLGDSVIAGFDMSDTNSTKDFIRRVVVRLDDLEGEQGPVDYTDSLRDQLIDLPFVRLALVKGYFSGVLKASSGN